MLRKIITQVIKDVSYVQTEQRVDALIKYLENNYILIEKNKVNVLLEALAGYVASQKLQETGTTTYVDK